MSDKWRGCMGIAGAVLLLAALTKWWVQRGLDLGESIPVLEDWVRLTHVVNPGAAFGLHVGAHSRVVFIVLAVVALTVIVLALRGTPATDRGRLAALALVGGSASGNMLDRVETGGVVDFLDVEMGPLRWPVFNLADVGITLGAVLLMMLLWDEAHRPSARG